MSDDASHPLRLAIFGTPRSGNTWFRALLKTAFGAADFAEHDPEAVPWDSLPARAVVNLHATPDPSILDRLKAAGVRPVVIARHPLDALISILHFAPHHPASNGWLLGRGGGEDEIRKAAPTSPEFAAYAAGPRSGALLSVSALWWQEPDAIRVRYEDLVADTAGELTRVAAEAGATPVRPIAEVVAEHAIDVLRVRDRSYQHHMWKGSPGLWRHLIPAGLARAVADAHPAAFAAAGYACDPDEALTDVQAHANWVGTLAEANDRDVARLWDLIEAMRVAAEQSRCRIADLDWRLANARAGLDEQRDRLIRADAIIKETNLRGDALIRENNVRVDGLLRENAQRADTLLRTADIRAAAAETRLAESDSRLAAAQQAAARLEAEAAASRDRCEVAESRLAGVDPRALAVARRLSRLSTRFPRAAGTAERAVRKVRALRRAA